LLQGLINILPDIDMTAYLAYDVYKITRSQLVRVTLL